MKRTLSFCIRNLLYVLFGRGTPYVSTWTHPTPPPVRGEGLGSPASFAAAASGAEILPTPKLLFKIGNSIRGSLPQGSKETKVGPTNKVGIIYILGGISY